MSAIPNKNVNIPTPGVFGSYFTPSKTPQTPQQFARMSALFVAACIGVNALSGKGIFNDVVLTPIVEDLLYGGLFTKILDVSLNVIQGRPKTDGQEKTRATVRAVTIAAFFAMSHGNGLSGNFVHFWFLGRALGYLREETGGFTLPIALHMVHNGFYEINERLDPNSPYRLIPFAVALTTQIITLRLLGKNINPWYSIFPQKSAS